MRKRGEGGGDVERGLRLPNGFFSLRKFTKIYERPSGELRGRRRKEREEIDGQKERKRKRERRLRTKQIFNVKKNMLRSRSKIHEFSMRAKEKQNFKYPIRA